MDYSTADRSLEWLTVAGYIAFTAFIFWQVLTRSSKP